MTINPRLLTQIDKTSASIDIINTQYGYAEQKESV